MFVPLFCFCSSSSSFAYTQHWADSIFKAIQGPIADTFKVDGYMKLSAFYLYSDPDKANEMGKTALALAEKTGDIRRIGQGNSSLGNVSYSKGDYELALKFYHLAETEFDSIHYLVGLGTALNNIGLVYINMGDYAKGLDYQFRSLKIRELVHDSTGIAYNYNAIGVVYLQKGDRKNALVYQQRSLDMNERNRNERGVMTNENNIGNIYYDMGVYDKALEFQLRALKGAQKINDVNGMANATGNLGNVFLKQGLLEKAIDYYFRSIHFQEEIGDKAGMCSNYSSLAEVYMKQKKFSESIDANTKALKLANETGARDLLKNVYRGLAESYAAAGDNASAYKFLFNYSDLKDTISGEEGKRNIAEMQARFDNENKEKQIALLEQQSQIKELEATRKQNIQNFTVVGLVLVIILALLLYNRYRIKQKANTQLEAAYHLIEDKNKNITDSINYAKRIQQNLLPTEKYIDRAMKRLKE